jgi:hypothetical protein
MLGKQAEQLLIQAIDMYVELTNSSRPGGSQETAQTVLDNLSQLLPNVDEAERQLIFKRHPQLRDRLASSK